MVSTSLFLNKRRLEGPIMSQVSYKILNYVRLFRRIPVEKKKKKNGGKMGQRSDKEKIMGYKKTAKLFNVPEGTVRSVTQRIPKLCSRRIGIKELLSLSLSLSLLVESLRRAKKSKSNCQKFPLRNVINVLEITAVITSSCLQRRSWKKARMKKGRTRVMERAGE